MLLISQIQYLYIKMQAMQKTNSRNVFQLCIHVLKTLLVFHEFHVQKDCYGGFSTEI